MARIQQLLIELKKDQLDLMYWQSTIEITCEVARHWFQSMNTENTIKSAQLKK
jgi:hypothetical protein